MPLGSSSAAPVIRPGPSFFSQLRRRGVDDGDGSGAPVLLML